MSVLPPDAEPSGDGPVDPAVDVADDTDAGKRKGKVKVRHTVAKAVGATAVVLALVTGLTVVFAYRSLNHNLNVQDLTSAINSKGVDTKKWPTGPSGAINILVMGSDNRNAPGDHVDNLTGIGKRSDTTILIHLSADRKRAYGISIPRDSIVNRPSCLNNKHKPISAPATGVMWNDAFNVGGPACTISQFEYLTHVKIDHWIEVDFAGFKSMVDAIGGVTVCLPHAINDPIGNIHLPGGTHKFSGTQALDYVRERHDLGDGSDLGREKRQQAFIASMIHQVFSAKTMTNPVDLYRFLGAATKSIHLDEGLGNLAKLAGLGYQFKNIGLSKIKFITTPWEYDPADPNRVLWLPSAAQMWKDIRLDKPLPRSMLKGSQNAKHIAGVTHHSSGNNATQQSNLANGLCA
jgi:LCP family protein required for cell wall assembly